ncbi:hypothetical protein RSOLAG22IIIB_04147 [Rhizoctonia solani]|uniref:Uncharacterized protein n=1 Tax=Rhizoctonia solani TaxID=456999 RepID=A0A0K6FUJ4_9AGAM|nr:hypothetical protein RSOLAG22IIIB_04147 [Rhizoctonia solani]
MSKSLKDALSRTKDKWKERLNVKSRNPSPTPPTGPIPELSTTLVPVAGLSSTTQGADRITVSVDNDPSLVPTSDGVDPAGRSVVWPAVRTLLAVLESSSDAFNPLKSAISGLNECIDIYERAAKGHKDYDELRDKLGKLLEDLATHIDQPMDSMMTNSVRLLCSRIEVELKDVEAKEARNIGRRLIEAMNTQDEILECYRRIHGHLERLILNADLSLINMSWSIKQAISEQATVNCRDEP